MIFLWKISCTLPIKLKRIRCRALTHPMGNFSTISWVVPEHMVQTKFQKRSPHNSWGILGFRMHSWWNHCWHLWHCNIFLYLKIFKKIRQKFVYIKVDHNQFTISIYRNFDHIKTKYQRRSINICKNRL